MLNVKDFIPVVTFITKEGSMVSIFMYTGSFRVAYNAFHVKGTYKYPSASISNFISENELATNVYLNLWFGTERTRIILFQDYPTVWSPLFKKLPKELYDKSKRYSSKAKVM